MTVFPRWLQSTQYTSLPLNNPDHNVPDKEVDEHLPSSPHPTIKRTRLLSLTVLTLLLAFAGTTGFVLGVFVSANREGANPTLPDTVPRGPIPSSLLPYSNGPIRLTLGVPSSADRLDNEDVPPQRQLRSPAAELRRLRTDLDSLIPNGLGYIQHPHLAPNLSVISDFHQLHCLYTLRRAYYSSLSSLSPTSPSSSSSSSLEDFDFGIARAPHTAHCFEYLRQSLMCSADSSVEPAGDQVGGFLGWGFRRRCRDYGRLKEWAERWRAFEGHGFIAMSAEVR